MVANMQVARTVDVVGRGRRLQLGRAWISVTNFFSEDLFSRPCLQHRLPPLLALTQRLNLALGKSCL